jgi:hypothetical protein
MSGVFGTPTQDQSIQLPWDLEFHPAFTFEGEEPGKLAAGTFCTKMPDRIV